jgi:hypothetical protein
MSIVHSRGFRRAAITVFALAALPVFASAQEADLLKKQLALQLPALWSVDDFTVQVSENTGTKVEPNIKSRFKADILLQRDLFTKVRAIGSTAVIRKIASAGKYHVALYGIATSVRSADTWKTNFNFENANALQIQGAGRGQFGPDAVLAGSPEEKARDAAYEAEITQQRKAQAAIESEQRKQAKVKQETTRSAQEDANKRFLADLKKAPFGGYATDGNETWPFTIKNIKLEGNGQFSGEVDWETANARHRIVGTVRDGKLFFKEVAYIKRGKAALHCQYLLTFDGQDHASGRYSGCGRPGKVSITFK